MITIPDVLKHAGLDAALSGLQALAEEDLMSLGQWTPLYSSGVRYKPEPRGRERWLTPSVVMLKGHGDCEDLAAWRAAELRVTGIDPSARAIVVRTGDKRWHAVVQREDEDGYYDEFEDPSAALGMQTAGGLIAPVRFALGPSKRGRDYKARIDLQGGRLRGTYGCAAGCPVRALRGAIIRADDSYMGQIPFLQPFLNMLMPATTPPTKTPPPGRAALPPARGGGSLEDGVLDLALQLRRLAKNEAARSLRRRY